MKREFITIEKTDLSAKTKEFLTDAGFVCTEQLAIYCYCNNGIRGIKGIGPVKAREIEELLVQEGWKCYPDGYDRLYFGVYGRPEGEDELLGLFYRLPETDEIFEDSLSTLTAREETVLKKYCGIGCECLTMDEIANELFVSRERVRQIMIKARRKLRHPSRSRKWARMLKYSRCSWGGLLELCNDYSKEIQAVKAENQRLRKIIEKHGITIKDCSV